MKEQWERTAHPLSLDHAEISDLIRPAFPGKKLIKAERIGTGLSNSNYKIYVDGSTAPFVIRLYRGGREVADKELAINKWVSRNIPVADFIYVDTSCNQVELPWAVIEWKEGVLLRDLFREGNQEDILSGTAAVGKILAHIHSYTFSESGFFDENLSIENALTMDGDRFLSFIEHSLYHQACGIWLGPELVQAVWSFCETNSPLLTEHTEEPVLVHSDFNGLNILVRNDLAGCPVSAVLDWEFSFSWNRYVDIGNMLRYEEKGSVIETHFIQAYQQQSGLLHKKWRLLSKLEDLVALCDMLNSSTPATPRRMSDLRNLVARTVQT